MRTTVTARHAELPAASNARTTTMLLPTSKGIVAVQAVFPTAVPDALLVLHCTETTPTLSDAVPLNTMEEVYEETTVEPGVDIVMEGGVASGVPPAAGAEGVEPVEPVDPVAPVGAEPVAPVDAAGPLVPVGALAPAVPVEPVGPVGPVGPVAPVDPDAPEGCAGRTGEAGAGDPGWALVAAA